MDAQMKGGGAPERPAIPDILIEATVRAIKAGMKPDDFARAAAMQQAKEEESTTTKMGGKRTKGKSERRLRGGHSRKVAADDEDAEPERTYRNFDERRMGFLVIGDQHRFAGINKIEEIVTEGEQPQTARNYRAPFKTQDERYRTSSIRLSYNVITETDGLINVLYKILDGGPLGLCWLDISFNTITKLDEDSLSQLPNLKILYLHGNSIVDMTEIPKLQALGSLKTLTLHGNPLEEEEGYRIAVIFYMPYLLHLDMVGVTKADRANSQNFGARYESYWKKRHEEFEESYKSQKKAAEISYTERVMKAGEDSEDEFDDNNNNTHNTKAKK
ncbi:Leucine-rich repeat-containing protein 51 [Folsomia candida]|uniref:Leucine-rich repeat-containing protein 51 n=1 Tax=Folsomia candida TaxID=158441 RepID=A0A226E2G4_FOLCA|nr:Leucine-rich repeat-containing protein 51 [Folsomia candida]